MQSIAELVTVPGEINVDFADVQAVMRDAGPAWMSIGWGIGEHRAREAAQRAITNPLLDVSIEGAQGVLFNIAGGTDLKLSELHEAAEVIQRVVDPEANIIFGMVSDSKMENEIKLTIIATGFPTTETMQERDEHIADMLRDALAGDGSTLDLPPFLRRYTKARPGQQHAGHNRVTTGPEPRGSGSILQTLCKSRAADYGGPALFACMTS